VNEINPAHYRRFPVELIVITEQLNFSKGNAVKYICRAGFKDGADELVDLEKAAWYVSREIARVKQASDTKQ
jgi:hypothetical protein